MPQLQFSLEVFDLDVAHFVQYKPDGGPFDPPILDVVVVHRDKMWFEKNLPLFQKFITDLEEFKSITRDIVADEPDKVEKPRKKRRKYGDDFLIVDESEVLEAQRKSEDLLPNCSGH